MAPPAAKPVPCIHWRMRMVAAEHGVYTARELHARLAALGLTLTESQIGRLLTGQPKRLNLEVLATVCAVFNVTPADLLTLTKSPSKLASAEPRPRRRRATAHDSDADDLPATPALPKGEWANG